jgi:hypothetical protein
MTDTEGSPGQTAVLDACFDAASLGQLRERVEAGAAAGCQASDSGPGPAIWPLRHGHGLWLVHQVADEVRVVSDPAGFRVTVLFASHG